MKDPCEFIVYSPEEKTLCELLVYYTGRRNWKAVITVAIELLELQNKTHVSNTP
jgi:hypothetical protein